MSTKLTPEQLAIMESGDATVIFEDHGQDFLRFHIKDRRVVGCEPFQADHWCGLYVTNFPEVGKLIGVQRAGHKKMAIKYPVLKVEPLWDLSDPFKAFVLADGKQLYHTDAQDRARMVKSFTEAQCHAAQRVDGLQKTVANAVERRLRQIHKQEAGGAS